MSSERECFVYIVPPGTTEFVTAGRFRWTEDGAGTVGRFVYGRSYRERADAVEFDPIELRLSSQIYETARLEGFFGRRPGFHAGLLGTARDRAQRRLHRAR